MTEALTGRVELLEGMAFRAIGESGHTVILDAGPDVGGGDRGLRPMELGLLALGGCTGMDVISVLRKMRQEVTGYQVRLHGDRADEHPKVFTTITVEHVVRGQNLVPELVHRAIELSITRYCSMSAMLERAAEIRVTYRLVDEETGLETVGEVTPVAREQAETGRPASSA